MNKKISFLVTISCIFFHVGTAQEIDVEISPFSESFQNSVIDQFERDKELAILRLDSVKRAAGSSVSFDDHDLLITQRIQKLQKTIPLEYNGQVKAYLAKYLSANYKPYMEKLLGLSQYYFPIYDKIFEQQDIPKEIKFLSVIESSLDPQTVSRSGAVGLWQFMYATAKGYDLTMDGSMDERRDTYSTTYAVCDYLQEAHEEFDDWLLALASYNCGRGGVRRAIKRSGLTNPTYWELAPFLPQETRNYIPKFIAMSYVLNHAEIYGLVPTPNELNEEHKVVMLDNLVSLETVANTLSVSTDLLKELNPAYKKTIVNASAENPRRLIIPYHDQLSDSLIYAALHNQSDIKTKESAIAQVEPEPVVHKQKKIAQVKASTYSTYTVRRGDTLSEIASRHKGASVTKLKADNKLQGSKLKIGQKLKVYKGEG